MSNCPRCNMFLAPGAQVCPNCQLNLMQYSYQQQQQMPHFHTAPMGDGAESKKEILYRKVLIAFCIFVFAEMLTQRLPELTGGFMYTMMKPFRYIGMIIWAGLPLFIALILPKRNQIRVLFIVLASIYCLISIYNFVYYEWFYYDWSDADVDYNF